MVYAGLFEMHSEVRVHVRWVPVTTAWHILGLWMEETASSYGGY
jgi:hypothetical protein